MMINLDEMTKLQRNYLFFELEQVYYTYACINIFYL